MLSVHSYDMRRKHYLSDWKSAKIKKFRIDENDIQYIYKQKRQYRQYIDIYFSLGISISCNIRRNKGKGY